MFIRLILIRWKTWFDSEAWGRVVCRTEITYSLSLRCDAALYEHASSRFDDTEGRTNMPHRDLTPLKIVRTCLFEIWCHWRSYEHASSRFDATEDRENMPHRDLKPLKIIRTCLIEIWCHWRSYEHASPRFDATEDPTNKSLIDSIARFETISILSHCAEV